MCAHHHCQSTLSALVACRSLLASFTLLAGVALRPLRSGDDTVIDEVLHRIECTILGKLRMVCCTFDMVQTTTRNVDGGAVVVYQTNLYDFLK